MIDQFKISNVADSKQLLFPSQADLVLEYLKLNNLITAYIDMSEVGACTSGFLRSLIFRHQKLHNFQGRLIFFNVSNPMVALKIHDIYSDFATEQTTARYIKLDDEIQKNLYND